MKYLEAAEVDRRYSCHVNRARRSNAYYGEVLGYGRQQVYIKSKLGNTVEANPIPKDAGRDFYEYFRVGYIVDFLTDANKKMVHKFADPMPAAPKMQKLQLQQGQLFEQATDQGKGHTDDSGLGYGY